MVQNTIVQEQENRHTGLLSELLAVMYRFSDPFGHRWVEVVHSRKIKLHSRYVDGGRTYEITQTMTLDCDAVPLEEKRS